MDTPKIVLITGANKGIGLATARVLAAAGHTVLLGARDPDRGAAAAAGLSGDVRYVRLDVTDPVTIAAAADLVERGYGRLDILVNNAAITRDQGRPPARVPVEAVREVYETNVFGVIAVTDALLPLLRRSPAGVVGNVSSGLGTFDIMAGDNDYPVLLAYNSSKAALNAVTVLYAHSLRADGITVNALSPGHCATDLNRHTGPLPVEQGGAYVAEQVLRTDGRTGVFLREEGGGTYPW